jgi:hypothetical protein
MSSKLEKSYQAIVDVIKSKGYNTEEDLLNFEETPERCARSLEETIWSREQITNELAKMLKKTFPMKGDPGIIHKCCLEPDDLVEIEKKRTGSIELEIEKCTKLLIALNENIEILAAKLVPILSHDSVNRKSADESEPHKCCNIATILSSFNCEIEDSIDKIKEIVERIEL